MSYLTWSTTASANVTVNGVNIAENCPPANINNAVREVMAGVAALRDAVPSVSGFMPTSAGTFTGTQPVYTGRGAYLHHNDSANTSGRVYLLPTGSANPASPSNGDVVLFYTP
jgi:hypothetical protein